MSLQFLWIVCFLLIGSTPAVRAAKPSLRGGDRGVLACVEKPITRCSCTEMLVMADHENNSLDGEDVKQGFRAASKLYHPETKYPSSSNEAFVFLTWCRDHMEHKGRRKEYVQEVVEIRKRAAERGWPSSRTADAIEDLNDHLQGVKRAKDHTPRNKKRHAETEGAEPVEEIHVFLDNSRSMLSSCGDNRDILAEMMPRLARTPASVHVVGANWETKRGWSFCDICSTNWVVQGDGAKHCPVCNKFGPNRSIEELVGPASRKIFGKDDDFILEDILPMWTMSSQYTYLWQYVLSVILQEVDQEHEVIIVTDGHDNDSDGDFAGKQGFNAVMNHLRSIGRQLPRFVVRFCGEDDDSAYRDLALASGGSFFGGSGPDADGKFIDHVKLSHAARARMALQQKHQYQKLLVSGQALPFSWFDALPPPPTSDAIVT